MHFRHTQFFIIIEKLLKGTHFFQGYLETSKLLYLVFVRSTLLGLLSTLVSAQKDEYGRENVGLLKNITQLMSR